MKICCFDVFVFQSFAFLHHFHRAWVLKHFRQSQTGRKMDGTISENLHDVSHLISVRSECARLYVGYLFSITLALCPIHTSHKCGPWNHQICTKSQQVKWLSTFAKLVKRLNPAKFTSTIPPLLPVETSTLRGSISDITTSQVLSPQLKLPSYIISDRSTPTSGP